ncbi:hypothetical protein PY479_14335 [Shewanella sp. A32]|uniref:hypothetical protein n=1 Tax=Shewanella sp. A32 TaxID=3031327 RepID=UPI0023B940F4|nr:hypothetical protein [Shewanella sp. A32]MDF0535448.1 hypothetical protein [Shewanella sp. A32]
MVRFSYDVNQHLVELQASDWTGLEQLCVDGQVVSRKFSFSPQSEHRFQLSNGECCRCQLISDPTCNQTLCRIYRQEQLIASLKHSEANKYLYGYQLLLLAGLSCLLLAYI